MELVDQFALGTSAQVRSRDCPLSQAAKNRRLTSSAVESGGLASDKRCGEDEVVTCSDLP